MGCSSCGTGDSKAPGCKSNGGCSSGGCNRMNVHDWLANLPFSDPESVCRVVEVSFNNGSRKDYFRNTTVHIFEKGDMVSLEGVSGFDVGMINLTGELVRLQLKKKGVNEFDPEIRKVLRRALDKDVDLMEQNKAREREAVIRSRAIARQLNLDMKISEVEFQADGRKATFYYIADDRVDFRELIKLYAKEFKVKVEMRQIGARQEAGKVGGIGSCGRELCCSTWLTDFKSVNTTAARYQNLSINQSKLSGQCGRLKCCLNYELDTYLDALQNFPENAETLHVSKGTAILIKKDIFKNLMWYILPDSSKQYPLTIERVKKIKQENGKNIVPLELEAVDLTSKVKEVEPEYADLVGQISLRTLDKAEKKKRTDNRGGSSRPPQQNPNQRNAPQRGEQRPDQRNEQRNPPRNEGRNDQRGGPQRNEQRPPQRNEPRNEQRNPQRNEPRPPRNDQRNGPGKDQRHQPGNNERRNNPPSNPQPPQAPENP